MRFIWMMAFSIGCDTKDPEADWDTGGSYSGWSDGEHADHDHDHDHDHDGGDTDGGDTDGGDTDGGDTDGGDTDGGDTDGGDDGSAWWASCQFGGDICIETTNADPGAWCDTEGGTSNVNACDDGYTSACAIPANPDGGTYADAATAYFYNDFDGETACTDVGGTYTAAGGGDWYGDDDGDSDDTGW